MHRWGYICKHKCTTSRITVTFLDNLRSNGLYLLNLLVMGLGIACLFAADLCIAASDKLDEWE